MPKSVTIWTSSLATFKADLTLIGRSQTYRVHDNEDEVGTTVRLDPHRKQVEDKVIHGGRGCNGSCWSEGTRRQIPSLALWALGHDTVSIVAHGRPENAIAVQGTENGFASEMAESVMTFQQRLPFRYWWGRLAS